MTDLKHVELAKRLGAVKVAANTLSRRIYTEEKGTHLIDEPFCWHFFDKTGKEVLYYHPEIDTDPVKVNRDWSIMFKNGLKFWKEI